MESALRRGNTCFSPSLILVLKNFSLDVAEINWRLCLEQRLDNINRIHLVLASGGKLVL